MNMVELVHKCGLGWLMNVVSCEIAHETPFCS